MKKGIKTLKKSMLLILAIFILSGCSKTSQNDAADTEGNNDASLGALVEEVSYSEDDYYIKWSEEEVNKINLMGDSIDFQGRGASINGSTITISSTGDYLVEGNLTDGQIIINTEEKGTVRLILKGVNISSKTSAAIYSVKADKTVISLENGTENFISDGENYVYSSDSTDEPNAAIFSKDDLTINGSGKLTLQSNFNNGITSKDNLVITGGTFVINSKDDGLMGRDGVVIKSGDFTIESQGDGIKATNDTEESKGYIVIEGGVFNIAAGADGLQAETSLFIKEGEFSITTGGGSVNSSYGKNSSPWGKWGGGDDTEEESSSAKAIKAKSIIKIAGGSFVIDSSDDAIHSNDSIIIASGNISISSGDDGIHADGTLNIEDGEVIIKQSYEGLESSNMTINGGTIKVTAADDGINIAGGNDNSSLGGRPGQNSFSSTSSNALNINGGYIVVDATGDGLDANGSIYIKDGTVLVNGPVNNGNGALDYDGVFDIKGGILIAAGSTGMAQSPSTSSTQSSIAYSFSQVQSSGTITALLDEKGQEIVAFAPSKQYQSIIISLPGLEEGKNYTISSGGKSKAESEDGLYQIGEYEGGTDVTTITISGAVSGNAGGQGGFPGGGNKGDSQGGGQKPGGNQEPGSGRK